MILADALRSHVMMSESTAVTTVDRPATLRADEVHVWYVFSDRLTEPRLLERYAAMLTSDERARRDRYMFAKDRHQFVVTRGLLRTLLARYLALDPAGCTFVT